LPKLKFFNKFGLPRFLVLVDSLNIDMATYLPKALHSFCWTLVALSFSLSYTQPIGLLGRGSARHKATITEIFRGYSLFHLHIVEFNATVPLQYRLYGHRLDFKYSQRTGKKMTGLRSGERAGLPQSIIKKSRRQMGLYGSNTVQTKYCRNVYFFFRNVTAGADIYKWL
jgi:hypothetical protein